MHSTYFASSIESEDFSVDRKGRVTFPGEVVVSVHHDSIGLETTDTFVLMLEEQRRRTSNFEIFLVAIERLVVVIQDETRKKTCTTL